MSFATTRHTTTVGPESGAAFAAEMDAAFFAIASVIPIPLNAYGGTADIATATGTTTLPAWVAGVRFSGVPASTNTVIGPTLNIDGAGAKTIADENGVSLQPGQHIAGRRYDYYFDGSVLRVLNLQEQTLFKALVADDTGGQNVATAQPWMPTAGGVTVAAGITYEFDGVLYLSRSAGTTSHTISLLFGGAATLTAIGYLAEAMIGDANSLVSESAVFGVAATALAVKAASTSATEQAVFKVKGIVKINAAGTFIPQFIYSAAPGGAPTVKAGTFFRLRPVTSPTGTWA